MTVDSLGRPGRVNPCVPVAYAVNIAGAPPGALAAVRGAVDSLAAASGLRFTYSGLTNDHPNTPNHLHRRREQTQLLIAWTAPGESIVAFGFKRLGITYPTMAATPRGPVIVGADILVDAGSSLLRRKPAYLQWVLLHELGHGVGLRHVDLPDQIMSDAPGPLVSDYGSGDRLGLRTLGAGSCLQIPVTGWAGGTPSAQ